MKLTYVLAMSGFSMMLSLQATAEEEAESPYLDIQWNSRVVRSLLTVRTGLCQADDNADAAPVKSKYDNGDEWPRKEMPSVLRAMFYLAYDYYGMGLNHYFTLRQDLIPDFTKRFATAKPLEYKTGKGLETIKLVTRDYTAFKPDGGGRSSAEKVEIAAKGGDRATTILYRHAVLDPFDLTIVADQINNYRLVGLSATGKKANLMHIETSSDYIQKYYYLGTARDSDGAAYPAGLVRTESFLYPATREEGSPDYQLYSYSTKQQLEPVRAPYFMDGHESFGEGMLRLDPRAAQYALCAQWRMQQERERNGQATDTDRLLKALMHRVGFSDENNDLWVIPAEGY